MVLTMEVEIEVLVDFGVLNVLRAGNSEVAHQKVLVLEQGLLVRLVLEVKVLDYIQFDWYLTGLETLKNRV